ncbi:MAG: hypothetical protein IIA85_00510 [Nanoarchaeota archaeon]|nr:hypothetical protein [Nanoarchaeota archaeon]
MMFLQAFSFAGGGIGDLLSRLEQLGFFSYALPFLILFALIFGVLSRMNLFGTTSKVTNAIISLSVSLMALQFGFVSQFFSEIFPRMGVGLVVILLILIVVGLVNPTKKWNKGVMVSLGVIIVGIILYQTFGANYWYNVGYWWPENWLTFLIIGLVIFTIGSIISNTPESGELKVGPVLRNLFSSNEYK